ncbi:MarC family transcriptional regulator [Croceicoccus estronivorus]|uniref:MarC family protein n=1 Tax=Croceicoccus estronivorus TaxID=1172626 RepID=UPI00082BA002|nr:MarC family protein [Croceicoccus estronivorus]OCC23817.1 MarC family transcriptional regulator [Croceicoccus estronivorus]
MYELFASAFVTLFVVIDPPGCAPIFAGLVADAEPARQRALAIRASIAAFLILLLFALFGERLLAALHIELYAFRIAGGIMLFVIALEMVFERRTQRREQRAEKVRATPDIDDVAIFPVAMPMLAGPGAIASIMLLMARADGMAASLAVLGALAAVMAVTLATLMAAAPLMRVFGSQVESVATRLLGVLLAALAAQFVIDGLKGAFGI